MRNRPTLSSLLAMALLFSGCESQTPSPPTPPPTTAPPQAEPPPPAKELAEADFITGTAALRKQPDEARRIEIAGKKVANWLATLYRGEAVTVLARSAGWAKVRTSGDVVGHVQTSRLLGDADAEEATVIVATKTFARPDLVALADTRIESGTLLYIVDSKGSFKQVNHGGSRSAWVLADGLLSADVDVAASKLITRIRSLDKSGDAGASGIRKLLASEFANSRVARAFNGETESPKLSAPIVVPELPDAGENVREVRFSLVGSAGQMVSLALAVDGVERCKMIGRLQAKPGGKTGDATSVQSACTLRGDIKNEAKAKVSIVGFVITTSGKRVDQATSSSDGLADVYDAQIDVRKDGSVELMLAMACPWVWILEDGHWQRRVEIIQNLNSRSKRASQTIALGRVPVIDGMIRLQVREEKYERSHLDEVVLIINGLVVTPSLDSLRRDDGREAILTYGQQLELRFDTRAAAPGAKVVEAQIRATGYYEVTGKPAPQSMR